MSRIPALIKLTPASPALTGRVAAGVLFGRAGPSVALAVSVMLASAISGRSSFVPALEASTESISLSSCRYSLSVRPKRSWRTIDRMAIARSGARCRPPEHALELGRRVGQLRGGEQLESRGISTLICSRSSGVISPVPQHHPGIFGEEPLGLGQRSWRST